MKKLLSLLIALALTTGSTFATVSAADAAVVPKPPITFTPFETYPEQELAYEEFSYSVQEGYGWYVVYVFNIWDRADSALVRMEKIDVLLKSIPTAKTPKATADAWKKEYTKNVEGLKYYACLLDILQIPVVLDENGNYDDSKLINVDAFYAQTMSDKIMTYVYYAERFYNKKDSYSIGRMRDLSAEYMSYNNFLHDLALEHLEAYYDFDRLDYPLEY